jgi:addiction module RelB/DinJ family antitoxin
MAAKTANVLARVEPEIKEKAEAIMSKLGIPASVVINMLYKQIVMTKSIPFSLSLPAAPMAGDEMDIDTFNTIMQNGLDEAKADHSRPASEVFANLRRGL